MPSTSYSRRGLLAAASGALGISLAGCSGSVSDGSSTHRTRTDAGGTHSSTHEYAVRFARAESDDPFVYRDEEAAQNFETGDEDASNAALRGSTLFVLDEAAATDLRFETASDELRPFVAATDFESESIVVQQRSIGDCYYRDVTGVEARDDDFDVHYCRWLKEPTTPCEADTEVMEAIVLRVARPYAEPPSSRGSTESAVCRGAGSGRDSPVNGSTSDGDGR